MKSNTQSSLFFALIGLLFFLPFLGGVHLFDWDEINFAEIAREMIVLDNYLEIHMNYETFTEKPPLFFWLQAASMRLLGVGDYAARFPNALAGVIVLPLLYTFGKKLRDRQFGYLWALAYFGSILPHLYFKSGIIDPIFNVFIFLGLYFLILHVWKFNYGRYYSSDRQKIYRFLILAGVFTGLATLTKGPVAYLITVLTLGVYWASVRFKWYISVVNFLIYSLVTFAVVAFWGMINYMANGPEFLIAFTIRQWELLTTPDAGHGGFLGYHFVVLLLGCFPASIFALQTLFTHDRRSTKRQMDFTWWMKALFWVVLILFSIVSTKIVHYSSLAYYPITYLAALSAYKILRNEWKVAPLMKIGLVLLGGIFAGLTIALPFLGKNIHILKSLAAKDPFALANLQADVYWSGWESIAGFVMLIVVILFFILYRKAIPRAINALFYGTAIWVTLTLFLFIGKIESYSQRAAISFWQSLQGKSCYVYTYDYKSYAHFYYSRVKPYSGEGQQYDRNWLLHGEVDKPVYISCKVTAKEKLESEVKDAILVAEENGFYFYKRTP